MSKNDSDRAHAARIGREVEEAILELEPRSRLWIEVQTDSRGHVRADYEIRKGVVRSLRDSRDDP